MIQLYSTDNFFLIFLRFPVYCAFFSVNILTPIVTKHIPDRDRERSDKDDVVDI